VVFGFECAMHWIVKLPVWIEQEIFIELNDGRRVTKAEYTDYSERD
jgi:hypothetical protein